MHTLELPNTIFHYNSDLSGDVYIVVKSSATTLNVSGADLIVFVAEYVRNHKVAELEDAPIDKILGV